MLFTGQNLLNVLPLSTYIYRERERKKEDAIFSLISTKIEIYEVQFGPLWKSLHEYIKMSSN